MSNSELEFLLVCSIQNCSSTLLIFYLRRKSKAEESADEARWVEAAASPTSVKSPPWTCARLEAVREEEEATTEAGETSADDAEKAASVEEVRTPPASPSSVPPESPGREPCPADRVKRRLRPITWASRWPSSASRPG